MAVRVDSEAQIGLIGGEMSSDKAVNLLARLTTRGVQPDATFGGIPEFSRTDIAAACTNIKSLPFHLVMAKYCDDVHSALQAMGELQEEMCHRSTTWAEMNPFRRGYVAAAMVDEFVGARRCRKCKGTGETKEGAKVVECKSCGGSGQRPPSSTSRAKACEIPESTFRSQRLSKPYEDMMRHLSDMEIGALERISRKAS